VLALVAAAVSVAPQAAIDAVVGAGINATTVEPVEVHAGLPTHLSGPVAMSAVAILAGVAGFPKLGTIRGVCESLHRSSRPVHPTVVYDWTLRATDRLSTRAGAAIHSGRLRTYVWWLLLSACSLMLLGFVRATVGLPTPTVGEVSLPMVFVLSVAVIAAIAVALTDTQVTGVLTLGILGYMVAIFYILVSGPDLALTQLVVESLTLLIFLLVLEQMPSFYGELDAGVLARDALLSAFVGGAAFVAVLVATETAGEGLTETAAFYVDNAVPEGGGTNIVNVILTDFRAFDTLGESIVIVIAALSVFVLLAMRTRGETQ
jgi:multicomponent Na+:H+ antiporter subunit A